MNEISISKELKDFLQQLQIEHHLGNIWLAKKYNKRWDYIFGFHSRLPVPTKLLLIKPELALFIDQDAKLPEAEVLAKIEEMLDE
ncbi:MAG: hypothetical protein PWQ09_31 [Candidatus Cloacimonadota bacterium]|nr:hypothetical protein [Candidatus Cloacimonadota bacterium]